jgi:hypothetical protein
MFEADPDIDVGEVKQDSDSQYEINIQVHDSVKCWALKNVMPKTTIFGDVTIRINIELEDGSCMVDHTMDFYKSLFRNNPIVRDCRQAVDPAGGVHGYIRFEPEVIQFYHDDISDYSGNWSGLAQDIAEVIFYDFPGIHFCTASLKENGK